MKKIAVILTMAALLTGCAVPETYETLSDTVMPVEQKPQKQLIFSMPQEAQTPVLQNDSGKLYQCDGYTLSVQTFSGGDTEKTLKEITGRGEKDLTVLRTKTEFGDRLDFVWTAAGETGLQLGRGCVLSDGHHHYVLSTMALEEKTGQLRETWQDIFSTARLTDGDKDLNTGS